MAKLISPDMALNDQLELSGMKSREDDGDGDLDGNAEGSLNNEFNEGETADFDNYYKPYSFDEIEEHIGTITSMEHRISDLMYLAEDLRKFKGMNQGFAMEAEKLLPGFGGVPIAYYSKDTTLTRYKLAVEEINGGMWVLLAAAVAALVTLVYKLIVWLFGDSGSSGSTGGSSFPSPEVFKEKTEAVKESNNVLDEILKLAKNDGIFEVSVKVVEDTSAPHSKKYHSVEELINDYVKNAGKNGPLARALNNPSPLLHDALNEGGYFKIMQVATEQMGTVKESMEGAIAELIDTVNGALEFARKSSHFETELQLKSEIPVIVNSEIASANSNPRVEKLATLVERINDIKLKAIANHRPEQTPFYRLGFIYVNCLSKCNIIDLLKAVNNIEPFLTRLHDELSNAEKHLAGMKADVGNKIRFKDHSTKVQQAITKAREELVIVGHFLKQVHEYVSVICEIFEALPSCHKEILKVINEEAKNNGHIITEGMLACQKQLVDELDPVIRHKE